FATQTLARAPGRTWPLYGGRNDRRGSEPPRRRRRLSVYSLPRLVPGAIAAGNRYGGRRRPADRAGGHPRIRASGLACRGPALAEPRIRLPAGAGSRGSPEHARGAAGCAPCASLAGEAAQDHLRAPALRPCATHARQRLVGLERPRPCDASRRATTRLIG